MGLEVNELALNLPEIIKRKELVRNPLAYGCVRIIWVSVHIRRRGL